MMHRSVGTALPTFFDYYDVSKPTAQRWKTVPIPSSAAMAAPGHNPCTLSFGHTTDLASIVWFFETEGLPSRTQDGKLVIFPCHASPAGTSMDAVLSDSKSIAILRPNGTVDTRILFSGFTGVRGTATGLRQAVTINGGEFWLAGIANFEYGIRYLSSPLARRSTRILGQTMYPDGHYQPATIDVRGLTVWNQQLYMTSAYVTEVNHDGNTYPYTPWGGIERIGSYNQLARASTNEGTLLRGWRGRNNYHSFIFEANQALWILEDLNTYVPVTRAVAAAEQPVFYLDAADVRNSQTRPLLKRVALSTKIVRWVWSNALVQWSLDDVSVKHVTIPDAMYTLVYRTEEYERAAGGLSRMRPVIYTVGRKQLYRVLPKEGTYTRIAVADPGQLFRGIALAPDHTDAFTRSPTPTPFPSPTRSPTATATRTQTPSRSRKPRN